MITSIPSKILIGISQDADECKELLCWAIKVIAHPGDTIVAMHIIETEAKPDKKATNRKKEAKQPTRKYQNQVRKAKSFVISIMGELIKTCQSIEVNLEARVGLSSSAGRGLIEEAKSIEVNYLIIGNRRNQQTNRSASNSVMKVMRNKILRNLHFLSTRVPSRTISRYCCDHIPDSCSLVVLRRNSRPLKQYLCSNSMHNQESEIQSSGKWSEKNSYSDNSFSSEGDGLSSNRKCARPSPKSVLDICEGDSESNTDEEEEEEGSNSGESCTTTNTSLMAASEFKGNKQELKKPMSPFTRFSSLFHASYPRKQCEAFNRENHQQPFLRCFSFQEIANATKNFQKGNLVGQGGYSEVYRGVLGNGNSIAVKRLAKDNSNPNKEKEFLMELGIIGHVNHPNTAKLVGYCIESGLYLIFRFYPNGTLASALHGQTVKSVDWPIRYRIVLGIARGLHYLHKCCKHRIIHRDIKASNVLLGPDFEPQISDFGLAKWLPTKWTHHAAIPIEGTFGYLAPEYFMHGIVDEKTDVFALGILFLEIITGRRPVDPTNKHLLLWARPLMESGNLSELVDPKLEGRYDKAQLYRVALTASQCVRQSPRWRPSMTEVLQLLTYGEDPEVAKSWRIPKFTSDEMDDYSMVFGYQLPFDLSLEDI